MKLTDSVKTLTGVGPVVERGLQKLGLETIGDLLNYFPRKWEDYSKITKIRSIRPGNVALLAHVETIHARRSFRNRRLAITEAILSDGTGTIKATWFNQPYLAQTLKPDEEYLFAGVFEFKNSFLSLQNPTFEKIEGKQAGGRIFSVYPENKVITSKIIRKLVAQCIDLSSSLSDYLPVEIEKDHKLTNYAEAIRNLHQPESTQQLEEAKRRLAFGELFSLILTSLVLKRQIKTEVSPKVSFKLEYVEKILGQLDFKLTDAQRKVAWQIFQDLEGEHPMNRMLEGDVGSGKTLVALLAAAQAIKAGYQVALMVPTEILARQHAKTAEKLLNPLGIKTELLISALKTAEKKLIHDQLASGDIGLVIGTHALLGEKVEFKNLGLIVIDEQHRFGVNQRRAIKTKAKTMPHVLTMTATPIPRSLALVVYGDLDISVIDELPPGRKPVKTQVVFDSVRGEVYKHIEGRIAAGEQVFVVCPLIDESDVGGRRSVTAEADRLNKIIFSHRRLAILHGKMKPDEKESIMTDFRNGKYDILISTTVVEVGVDIPNASVIIIENADRFGLAALHQLRGRVGRSGQQAYCYLFTDSDSPTTVKRLGALERSNDGFRIAQIDLELRGPGEIYGARQHGQLDLRLTDVTDAKLIAEVHAVAQAFLDQDKMVKYPYIMKRVDELKALTTLE
ncbi:ATP-dependent DNA helicase RecG [Candidatus Saccharibacteria bacterium]|nr:ATP-dependent DNA helicase RecG [Candidatus Saccharibacteria bacterium]